MSENMEEFRKQVRNVWINFFYVLNTLVDMMKKSILIYTKITCPIK